MTKKIIYVAKHLYPQYGLDVSELCDLSEAADMTTLTPAKILHEHFSGFFGVLVGKDDETEAYTPEVVVSYAANTKDRIYKNRLYAQIGGFICLPAFRGMGIMSSAVARIMEQMPDLPEEYHGVAAVGNEKSSALLKSFGMAQVDMVPSESTGEPHPLFIIERGQLPGNTVE